MMRRSQIPFLIWLVVTCFGAQVSTARVTTITFGGDPAYPPFEWLERGQPTGFHIEIEQAMGAAAGTTVRTRLRPWPETVEALKRGQVDVVPMFRSEERERFFWFSEPIHFAHHAIYTIRDPARVSKLEQLALAKIAVERSSFAHDQFAGSGKNWHLVLEGTTKDALIALAEGRADYAVLATGATDYLAAHSGIPARRVGMPFWPREYSFAVRRDRPETASWVADTLDQIASDGTFELIQKRWEPAFSSRSNAGLASTRPNWWVVFTIALGGAVILFLYARRTLSAFQLERQRRSAAEESARYLTQYDRLTTLPNLDRFLADIAPAVAGASDIHAFDVIALKVTNIEDLAKALGRDHAKDVLRSLAKKLECAGFSAGVIAQGTFAVATTAAEAQQLSSRLDEVRRDNDTGVPIEISWGAAGAPEHGHDVEDLLHKAELALAATIARGRTWLRYDASLEPDRSDLQLIRDFEAYGSVELFPLFQPQLDLSAGQITSAEVLGRWVHRERGSISPSEFIPLIERAGLISHVTERMLDAAIRESVRFRSRGASCRFSFNVSVTDIRESDLPAMIANALDRHGGTPGDIIIELTESGAVEDSGRAHSVLQRLRNMGLGVAIDDFGTGFSSLANLVDLPFDELKIDQLFVKRMLASPAHRSVVRSAIKIGHEMGLTVVAEGAEDGATVAALAENGCDRVQGYAISKPVDADDLLVLCSRYQWIHRKKSITG